MIAGLTGGIGSGKSTVARLFRLLGAATFDSDEAAKEAYYRPGIKNKVIGLLGEKAYGANGNINRDHISSVIFNDASKLEKLNAIIHPEVGTMFREFLQQNTGRIIIKESALLFEANVTAGLDSIIVVAAPTETRISRVMQRDGLSREDVERKLRSQISQEEKIRRASHVIYNDEKHLLIPQTETIFKLLQS